MMPRLSLVKLRTSKGKKVKKVVLTIEGKSVDDIRPMVTLIAAALGVERSRG